MGPRPTLAVTQEMSPTRATKTGRRATCTCARHIARAAATTPRESSRSPTRIARAQHTQQQPHQLTTAGSTCTERPASKPASGLRPRDTRMLNAHFVSACVRNRTDRSKKKKKRSSTGAARARFRSLQQLPSQRAALLLYYAADISLTATSPCFRGRLRRQLYMPIIAPISPQCNLG